MTQHFFSRQLRFFMTASAPCPYLPGQFERKVFANLPFSDGADVNDALTQAGFRRSQNIAYRPACEACIACVSVRIPVADFELSRSRRRILARNADLSRDLVEAEATMEQFDLLRLSQLGRAVHVTRQTFDDVLLPRQFSPFRFTYAFERAAACLGIASELSLLRADRRSVEIVRARGKSRRQASDSQHYHKHCHHVHSCHSTHDPHLAHLPFSPSVAPFRRSVQPAAAPREGANTVLHLRHEVTHAAPSLLHPSRHSPHIGNAGRIRKRF